MGMGRFAEEKTSEQARWKFSHLVYHFLIQDTQLSYEALLKQSYLADFRLGVLLEMQMLRWYQTE